MPGASPRHTFMTFRKSLFWVHLFTGIAGALFIAIMCITGAALAFEKELLAWAERDARQIRPATTESARLSLETMAQRLRDAHPDARPASVTVFADPGAAVAFSLGRDRTVYVGPHTGEVREPSSTRMHDFMHAMEDWHRWLAISGDHRPIGKVINGVANIVFLLLAITGLYLWIPRKWSREKLRSIVWFRRGLTGKPRDFNWHNVIGLWTAPVLIVLTLTAIPISFRWGNALVYRLVGETPPAQSGPPVSALPPISLPPPAADARPLNHDAQFAAIQQAFPDWEQITLRLAPPSPRGNPASTVPPSAPRRETASLPLSFSVKTPGTWPRTAATSVVMNPFTGELLRRETFADQSAGRQLRIWTRFLHTGEAFGWPGQLVAGLACMGGGFLVYTGLALSWRRFFGPPKQPKPPADARRPEPLPRSG